MTLLVKYGVIESLMYPLVNIKYAGTLLPQGDRENVKKKMRVNVKVMMAQYSYASSVLSLAFGSRLKDSSLKLVGGFRRHHLLSEILFLT